jgi:DNA (cytosine-5)-methyltransferase 1
VRCLRKPKEVENWTSHNDHFYLNQKGDIKHGLFFIDKEYLELCNECLISRVDEITRAQRLFKANGPLRGLELFSGKILRIIQDSQLS